MSDTAISALDTPTKITLTNANTAYGVSLPQNCRKIRISPVTNAVYWNPKIADAASATPGTEAGDLIAGNAPQTFPCPGTDGFVTRNLLASTRRGSLFTGSAGTVVYVTALR